MCGQLMVGMQHTEDGGQRVEHMQQLVGNHVHNSQSLLGSNDQPANRKIPAQISSLTSDHLYSNINIAC